METPYNLVKLDLILIGTKNEKNQKIYIPTNFPKLQKQIRRNPEIC